MVHQDQERLVLARTTPEETVLIVLNRRPQEPTLTIDLPTHWGAVAGAVPVLEEQDATVSVKDGRLTLRGGNYSYGFYRVRW